MTGNKVCKKCGKKNLGWDMEFHRKQNKWKLENHKRVDGKWCNKPPESKILKLTKKNHESCELCTGNAGYCYTEETHRDYPQLKGLTLAQHKAVWHPNGEVLDDIDMMGITNDSKVKLRNEWLHQH